jgi:hypothetical protein
VGAWRADTNGNNSGSSYVVFGKASGGQDNNVANFEIQLMGVTDLSSSDFVL